MGWGPGMGWWMWLLIAAGVIGFWVLVAMLVRAILHDRNPPSPPQESPLAVLDRRLASGEIDIQQYHQLRRTLLDGH